MDEDRQEVFDALCTRASQLFGKDASEFTLETKWADLGVKSVQVSQITTYLEDELDIEVPYMKFRRCETFGDAVEYVAGLLDE
ncbi:MAG: acyl carrier protein [Atopobiaceae bacterium]|nr:acyl carrier protein [Atopobiaceae bacterium]